MILKKWFQYALTIIILNTVFHFLDLPWIIETVLWIIIYGFAVMYIERDYFNKK